jgi:hypothetical protein
VVSIELRGAHIVNEASPTPAGFRIGRRGTPRNGHLACVIGYALCLVKEPLEYLPASNMRA